MRKQIAWGIIIIIMIASIALLAHLTGIDQSISLQTIQRQRFIIKSWTHQNYFLAVLLYTTVYFCAAALALPAVSLLTITGGFLFGPLQATIYTVISATLGAIIAFLASRYLFGSLVRYYYQHQLQALYGHLTYYGIFYLIWARLIPIFPFFLANILAGLMPISIIVFTITTALGIIPVTFLYASAGQQIMSLTSIHDIFSVYTLGIFIMLALLATLPLLIKKFSS